MLSQNDIKTPFAKAFFAFGDTKSPRNYAGVMHMDHEKKRAVITDGFRLITSEFLYDENKSDLSLAALQKGFIQETAVKFPDYKAIMPSKMDHLTKFNIPAWFKNIKTVKGSFPTATLNFLTGSIVLGVPENKNDTSITINLAMIAPLAGFDLLASLSDDMMVLSGQYPPTKSFTAVIMAVKGDEFESPLQPSKVKENA